MEINKPDRGVFKGIGSLEVERHINKKNIHQFQYTHLHPNDNITSFQRFFSANKSAPAYQKVHKNTNQSSFQFGTDQNNYFSSLTKADYKAFQKARPALLIKQKEEGIEMGDPIAPAQHFMTTAMEKFGLSNLKEKTKVSFKDRGAQRFNPITGQMRTLTFGFQDFAMNRDNNYRANNFTNVPQKGQRIDIISGRKLTYK